MTNNAQGIQICISITYGRLLLGSFNCFGEPIASRDEHYLLRNAGVMHFLFCASIALRPGRAELLQICLPCLAYQPRYD